MLPTTPARRDKNVTAVGPCSPAEQAVHREAGGETRGPEDHAFTESESGGFRHRPRRRDSYVLAEPPGCVHAEIIARDDHFIALFERTIFTVYDGSHRVNAGSMGIILRHAAVSRGGEHVLVIQRRY